MSVPLANLPANPLNVAMAPFLSAGTVRTTTLTLTAPTSDTLLTGLTVSTTIPSLASYVRVTVMLPSVTVSAAATLAITLYTGATSGTLTTAIQSITFVTATGQTTAGGTYTFYVPVSTSASGNNNLQAGSTSFLSIAASASTGNFVVNGAATTPANVFIEAV